MPEPRYFTGLAMTANPPVLFRRAGDGHSNALIKRRHHRELLEIKFLAVSDGRARLYCQELILADSASKRPAFDGPGVEISFRLRALQQGNREETVPGPDV